MRSNNVDLIILNKQITEDNSILSKIKCELERNSFLEKQDNDNLTLENEATTKEVILMKYKLE